MKFEISKVNTDEYIRYSIVIDGTTVINTTPYATGNCQWTPVAYAGSLYSIYKSLKEVLYNLRKTHRRTFPTNCVLIDVKKDYIEQVDKDFTDCIIRLRSPYTSSNGSNMCIFLIELPHK